MTKDGSALTMQVASLNANGARTVLAAAEEAAVARGVAMSIAVVDHAGDLMAFHRMDQALPIGVGLAIAKAHTAARTGGPTQVLQEAVDAGMVSMLGAHDVCPLGGGVPIRGGAAVVGAVGASGGSAEDDMGVATVAAEALMARANRQTG